MKFDCFIINLKIVNDYNIILNFYINFQNLKFFNIKDFNLLFFFRLLFHNLKDIEFYILFLYYIFVSVLMIFKNIVDQ